MSNPFYVVTGSPGNRAPLSSAVIRAEFAALQVAFDKFGSFSGNAGRLLRFNLSETGFEPDPNVYLTQAAGDSAYVNSTGDTMSGSLVVSSPFAQPLGARNTTLDSTSTSGTTGLLLGDVASGVEVIQRSKRTANTASVVLNAENGYSTPLKMAEFYGSEIDLFIGGGQKVSINSGGFTLSNGTISLDQTLALRWNASDLSQRASIIGRDAGAGPGELLFLTNNSSASPTERMRIDSNGNVGIGSTFVPGDSATGASINGATSANYVIALAGVAAADFHADAGQVLISAGGTRPLILAAGAAERLRVTAAGAINIGGTVTAGGGFVGSLTGNASTATSANSATSASNAATATVANGVANGATDQAGNELGYRDIPAIFSFSDGATLNTAARGKCVIGGYTALTVPASVFAAGASFMVYQNGAASMTLTQGSGLTMRLAGSTTTGSRTVSARGMATVWFVSATECIVSGAGVT